MEAVSSVELNNISHLTLMPGAEDWPPVLIT